MLLLLLAALIAFLGLVLDLEALTLGQMPDRLEDGVWLFEMAIRGTWLLMALVCVKLALFGREEPAADTSSAPPPRLRLEPRAPARNVQLPELPPEPPLQLGEVIAQREYEVEDADGSTWPVLLRVGRPIWREVGWICPYRLMGLTGDYVHPAFGVDALDALSRAVHEAPALLEESVSRRNGRVLHDGRPGLGLGRICTSFLRGRRRRRRRGEMGALILPDASIAAISGTAGTGPDPATPSGG